VRAVAGRGAALVVTVVRDVLTTVDDASTSSVTTGGAGAGGGEGSGGGATTRGGDFSSFGAPRIRITSNVSSSPRLHEMRTLVPVGPTMYERTFATGIPVSHALSSTLRMTSPSYPRATRVTVFPGQCEGQRRFL
jgi:hypothetical protein